jgi:hypothetical protein
MIRKIMFLGFLKVISKFFAVSMAICDRKLLVYVETGELLGDEMRGSLSLLLESMGEYTIIILSIKFSDSMEKVWYKSLIDVIIAIGKYNFKFCEFHETDLAMIAEICENLVSIEVNYLHNGALFDKEEVLALGPCVLSCVTEYLSLLQKRLIFLIHLLGYGSLLRRIFAFIEEEVIVLVLIVDAFLEEVIDLLQVG